MYYGNHTNISEKLINLQNKRRTKSTLLEWLVNPMLIGFIMVDFITIQLYALNLFDESPWLARFVAFVLAVVLDGCPSIAGSLKAQKEDLLPRDKKAATVRIWMLLGAAAGAYAVFCAFCVISSRMQLPDVEDATLYMPAQFARMIVPFVTSVGAFAASWKSNHRDQLETLKAQRLQLRDLELETANAIRHGEYAMQNYNADVLDYQFACTKLHSLHLAAQAARLTARMKLAEELGSLEAADALLKTNGLEELLNEEELKGQLLPPKQISSGAQEMQPTIHLENDFSQAS